MTALARPTPRIAAAQSTRSSLAFERTLAIFAQPDLEEHEAGGEHETDADERDRERLARTAADDRRARRAGRNQQRGRAERPDPRSPAHEPARVGGPRSALVCLISHERCSHGAGRDRRRVLRPFPFTR
jgi:hypothetical protein